MQIRGITRCPKILASTTVPWHYSWKEAMVVAENEEKLGFCSHIIILSLRK